MLGQAPWRRGRTVSLVAAALLALISGQTAAAQDTRTYEIERSVLAERKKDQVTPRISGSWVVWKDYRDVSLRAVDDSPNAQIFARNLDSDEEFDAADSNEAGQPAISGSIVVWTNRRGPSSQIRGVDLQLRQPFLVAESSSRQEWPAIAGTVVVWQDNRNGNWDIFARDLVEDSDRPIVEHPADQNRPAISGRTVVWEDWRDKGPGPDIFGYDLDSGRTFRVTSNHDAREPAIAGRWVVWVQAADQGVFARNLDDDTTIRLSTAAGPKSQPAIAGDLVVWTDERQDNRDVYGYDLAARTEFVIIREEEAQDSPHVDGSTFVWSDARGPNRDIVLGRLNVPGDEEPPPAVESPAPSEPLAAAPAPAPTSNPARLRIVGTDGQGVNLRAAPGSTAPALKVLPEGAEVTALGEPRQADGRAWRNVQDAGGTQGWVAADYLAPAP